MGKLENKKVGADRVFTRRVRVSGKLLSNFVFADQAAVEVWQNEALPGLEKKYGKLDLTVSDLPGLKIGDRCHVIGEGSDVFTIERLVAWDADRFGFVLDSGWVEEVAKCYEEVTQ